MARRKPTKDYRIVGCRGEWFAWKPGFTLHGWWSHVRRISILRGGKPRCVTAVFGRTPFEALERLKRIERSAA